MKRITITWRDEAYGALSGVQAAFRVYQFGERDAADLTDAEQDALAALYRRNGFEIHFGRAAWITYKLVNARLLVNALEAAGWAVEHGGRWEPDGPPDDARAP